MSVLETTSLYLYFSVDWCLNFKLSLVGTIDGVSYIHTLRFIGLFLAFVYIDANDNWITISNNCIDNKDTAIIVSFIYTQDYQRYTQYTEFTTQQIFIEIAYRYFLYIEKQVHMHTTDILHIYTQTA